MRNVLCQLSYFLIRFYQLLGQNPCQLLGYIVPLANALLTVTEPMHPRNGITGPFYLSTGMHPAERKAFFRNTKAR